MPTTNPVPSTDPTDLLFNAQKLDQVVNGAANSFTDRMGVVRRTLGGIDAEAETRMDAIDAAAIVQRDYIQDAADLVLAAAGYAPPVVYAAGISMTLQTQTVSYNGDTYAPKQSELPFTTSGTFEAAKFRLIQGVASADLPALVGQDLQDYAALRAYTGSAKRIYITGPLATAKPSRIDGNFQHDSTDTTSSDNGGTIIVGADGRRWKRVDTVITPYHFGAVDNKAIDSTDAIQRFFNYINSTTAVKVVCHGNFGISASLTYDAKSLLLTVSRIVDWDAIFWDISTNGLDYLIKFLNCQNHTFTGTIYGYGVGSSTYSSRKTLDIFLFDQYMSYVNISKLGAHYALRWGVNIENSNTQMQFANISASYCGTGADTDNAASVDLNYTISTITNTGTADSTTQLSSIVFSTDMHTVLTRFMGADYASNSAQQFFITIKDSDGVYQPHRVTAVTATNTIEVWPWVDPARTGSVANIVFGGTVVMLGNDSSMISVTYLESFVCGMGIWIKSLYGPVIGAMATQSCGIGKCIGNSAVDGVVSGITSSLYTENNYVDVLKATASDGFNYTISTLNWIDVGSASDKKFHVLYGKSTSYVDYKTASGLSIDHGTYGASKIQVLPASIVSIYSNTITPHRDYSMPMLVKYRDTGDISLRADYNLAKLTGKTGYLILAIGSGANNQPTGTWTFSPQNSDWSVNDGVTGASATLSGFTGATAIVVYADYLLKNWKIIKLSV